MHKEAQREAGQPGTPCVPRGLVAAVPGPARLPAAEGGAGDPGAAPHEAQIEEQERDGQREQQRRHDDPEQPPAEAGSARGRDAAGTGDASLPGQCCRAGGVSCDCCWTGWAEQLCGEPVG